MKTYLVPITDEVIKAMEKGEAPSFLHCATCLDGLTNGEIIQKIFPDAKISFEEEWDSYDDGDFCNSYVERFVNVEFEHAQTLTFSLDWWNRKWGE